jgi:hypothetical protein
MPIFVSFSKPALGTVEGSIGLKLPASVVLGEFNGIVRNDVLVGASVVHDTKTVLTTPPLLVVREGEIV